jgi:hypothetical protein
MRRLLMILTGSMLVILAACTKYEIPKPPCPEDLPTGVSYSADVQPIFDANCVMCHSGAQSPDLSPDWSYDELIDGTDSNGNPYVDTDFPCSSGLYEKLSAGHNAEEEDILTILGWIDEGAEDN